MNLNKKTHRPTEHIHVCNNISVMIKGVVCRLERWQKGNNVEIEIHPTDTTSQNGKLTFKDSYTLEEIQDRIKDGRIVKI